MKGIIEWKILEFEKYAVNIEKKWYLSADVFPSTSFSQMTKIVKVYYHQCACVNLFLDIRVQTR